MGHPFVDIFDGVGESGQELLVEAQKQQQRATEIGPHHGDKALCCHLNRLVAETKKFGIIEFNQSLSEEGLLRVVHHDDPAVIGRTGERNRLLEPALVARRAIVHHDVGPPRSFCDRLGSKLGSSRQPMPHAVGVNFERDALALRGLRRVEVTLQLAREGFFPAPCAPGMATIRPRPWRATSS
jgi:hypothetical protein